MSNGFPDAQYPITNVHWNQTCPYPVTVHMATLAADVRFALRILWKNKGFTAIAAFVLALGIGANSTVFALVNTMALKPRVGHPQGELVSLFSKDTTKPDSYRAFSWAMYEQLRQRTDVFSHLTAHNLTMVGLREGDTTHQGDLIYTVDDDLPQADLNQTNATLANARQTFDRAQSLSKTGSGTQANLDAAISALRVAEAHVETSKTRLARREIRAPVTGTVQQIRQIGDERIHSCAGVSCQGSGQAAFAAVEAAPSAKVISQSRNALILRRRIASAG